MDRSATTIMALGCLLLASCQDANVGSRTYPDAVVTLSQVDPAYRPYFAAQNGSNYSLSDQRAAFIKAAQTARGPMPTYEVRSSGTTVRRKPAGKHTGKSAGKGAGKGTGKKGAAKPAAGKKPTGKKTAAKPATTKKPAAKKPAAKKPAGKKR